MRKYRSIYVSLVFVTALAFLLQEQAVFAVMLLLEGILPLGLYLGIRREAKGIQIRVSGEATGVCNENMQIQILAESRRPLLFSGVLHAQIRIRNIMYGTVTEETMEIPLSGRKNYFLLERKPEDSGVRMIQSEQAVVSDLFGLCKVVIRNPEPYVMTVYPERRELRLFQSMDDHGSSRDGNYARNIKGRDSSEVFDLREYTAGDDIRSIHWKISSKIDTLVIKEASDAVNLDTLVLVDITRDGKNHQPDPVYERAVEVAAAVSEKLVDAGVKHYFTVARDAELKMMAVTDHDTRLDAFSTWMGIPFPEHGGTAMQLLQSMRNEYHFSKLIYITAGYLDEMRQFMDPDTRVTAICAVDGGGDIRYLRQDNQDMIYVPAALKLSEDFNIYF